MIAAWHKGKIFFRKAGKKSEFGIFVVSGKCSGDTETAFLGRPPERIESYSLQNNSEKKMIGNPFKKSKSLCWAKAPKA